MTPEARKILDIIDVALAGDDIATARDLWDVLSALRGPDNGYYTAKFQVTVPIRRAAFPLTAARYDDWMAVDSPNGAHIGAGNRASFGSKRDKFISLLRTGHFNQHGFSAALALGLLEETR